MIVGLMIGMLTSTNNESVMDPSLIRWIELLVIVALIPMVATVFSGLKARVDTLERTKADKEVLHRIENTMAEHRIETRTGFSEIRDLIHKVFMDDNHGRRGGDR